VEMLVALLLAKPVVVGALCMGTAALSSRDQDLGSLLTGAALLLLAGFAPLVLFKMAPLVEAPSVAHIHDLSRQPVHAFERAVEKVLAVASGAGAAAAVGGGEDMNLAGTLLAQASGGLAGSGPPDAAEGREHPLGPARPPDATPPTSSGVGLGGRGG